ncbi:MAG: Arginine-tRNA ligase [Microgenomates group bacterium GW2011_GWC1_38_12]|nr:MAG: Arginine-tRNA ligase [Microgenomates group bacterium GW2011_GWC1_38_12]
MRDKIIKALAKVTGLKPEEIHLDTSENEEFGDYSSNIAMQLFSQSKEQRAKSKEKNELLINQLTNLKSPQELAEAIVTKLKSDKQLMDVIEKIEMAGPGFINFWLKKDALVDNMIQNVNDKNSYGKSDFGKGKKIMVEYAHPNTHKAFHIGHLRNISIGESIVRLLVANGYKVIRANYQGDVGMHIAKALWGIKKLGYEDTEDVKARVEFLGKAYARGSTAYEKNDNAKKEIQEINKKIYSKEDEEINKLYKETRQWSLDYFESIYKRVDSTFDRLYFESECFESGKDYALEGLKKGILEKSDGAIIFPGKKYGLHDRVFITKEGVPTYEAKDLGLVKLQLSEFNPDVIAHVVGPEQSEYFKVVFKAQELLFPETKGKQLHVPYGWVRLKEGKMSSRTGKVILGEQLLDDAKTSILKEYKGDEKTAEQIAIGAVKYSFLKVGREQDIAFDLKKSISLEGNSGPYLQYTYARAHSVLRKFEALNPKHETNSNVKNSNDSNVSNLKNLDLNIVSDLEIRISDLNAEELSILRAFVHFPEIISMSARNYSPNLLCNYLYDLAQKFNLFYQKHGILRDESIRVEEQESVRDFRLALTSATGQILKNGLQLLGIESPEKM